MIPRSKDLMSVGRLIGLGSLLARNEDHWDEALSLEEPSKTLVGKHSQSYNDCVDSKTVARLSHLAGQELRSVHRWYWSKIHAHGEGQSWHEEAHHHHGN